MWDGGYRSTGVYISTEACVEITGSVSNTLTECGCHLAGAQTRPTFDGDEIWKSERPLLVSGSEGARHDAGHDGRGERWSSTKTVEGLAAQDRNVATWNLPAICVDVHGSIVMGDRENILKRFSHKKTEVGSRMKPIWMPGTFAN